MSMRYQWTASPTPIPDAVVVSIVVTGAVALADVAWPANPVTRGGDYLYPTAVPLALDRALDVRDHYGFDRIVIRIRDRTLWNTEWGELDARPLAL